MPRKGKKRVFRGTPKQEMKKKEENCAGTEDTSTVSVTAHVVNNGDPSDLADANASYGELLQPEHPQNAAKETQNPMKTASEKKIGHYHDVVVGKNGDFSTSAYDKSCSSGYRLIDLECLNDALKVAHICKGGGLVLEEDFTNRNGLCSTLNIRCTKCSRKSEVRTSKMCPGIGKSYDVNRRAVFAMSELGLGREGMVEFCGIFDMPQPSSSASWSEHNRTIHKVSKDVLQEELVNAGQRLRELSINKGETETTTDTTIDAMVSFDGTWHHRGFKSPHGVGVVMSVDTGEVLDAEVLSKDCVECTRMKDKDRDSDEFMIWEYHHFEGGYCANNFEGPSCGMEQEAAKVVWERSVSKHNLRYVKMLCDGDSKALNNLNNEHKPYGDDVVISKLDCVNHVHKRMGKGLRNLRKTSKVVTGGSGKLTESMIERLSDYYRAAIMDNTTTSTNPEEVTEKVEAMRKSIMAGLYHSVRQDDEDHQHQYCNIEWCKYLKDKRDNTQTYDPHRNTMPKEYLDELKPIYDRLSNAELLKRCVAGLTQNQNEALNRTIWKKCPKERYASAQAVERGVSSAILQWNCGSMGRRKLMEALGLPIGHHAVAAFRRKDRKRLRSSFYNAAERQKLKRKLTKEESVKAEQRLKSLHGCGYGAGQFND